MHDMNYASIQEIHSAYKDKQMTVRELVLSLLSRIAKIDKCKDGLNSILEINPDYTRYLSKDGLKGARIGINRSQKLEDFRLSEEGKAAFDQLCKALAVAGAVLVDNVNIDSNFSIRRIMTNEFKACMDYYLSTLKGSSGRKTLKDIIEYNQAHSAIALKYGQSILLDAQNNTSGTMTESEYIEAFEERERTIAELDRLFHENNIDVMLCETFTNIAPFTGFPSMTIPTGQRLD